MTIKYKLHRARAANNVTLKFKKCYDTTEEYDKHREELLEDAYVIYQILWKTVSCTTSSELRRLILEEDQPVDEIIKAMEVYSNDHLEQIKRAANSIISQRCITKGK